MGTVTIINTEPYKLQPVPEVGKEYHIFDDGKIKPSRHYIAKVLEVIPFEECDNTALLSTWAEEVSFCDFLYNLETDYFIKAESDFDARPLYFVRTVDGGWFSIDFPGYWMSARLDIDGELYKEMLKWYPDYNGSMKRAKESV